MPLVVSGGVQVNVIRLPDTTMFGVRGDVGFAAHDDVTELHGPTPYSLTARTRSITEAPDGTPDTYWLVNLVRPREIQVRPPSLLCSTS